MNVLAAATIPSRNFSGRARRRWLVAVLASMLAACASAPPLPPADTLFHDALFAAPSTPIDPASALAISPQMRSYIAARRKTALREADPRRRLLDALYNASELRLEFDASVTRTAAEAFDARMGNCLALVMMTAAFAKEMGLPVQFQSVIGDEVWDRSSDMVLSVGHVNVVLEERPSAPWARFISTPALVVDFMPSSDAARLRSRNIEERTVLAMFANNRAVESLADRRLDDAYWWARAALKTDPGLVGAYLTLGVVYRARQHPELAEAALLRVGEREPDNPMAMSNHVLLLRDMGRSAEADALAQRLARLDPHPPFSYFNEGVAAFEAHRLDAAKRLFMKEIDRAPYHHEFEFWLAKTYAEMNDLARAREHLARAMEVSTTRKAHDLYAAKLDRLRELGVH